MKRFWVMGSALMTITFSQIGTVQAQQVIPDTTLNTQVQRSLNTFTITGGTASGPNLFHSFQEFSIPTNGTAQFNLTHTPNISTIFSRVTGGVTSSIDGTIQISNSANPVSLFLLNPSGILLGPNARLNLGGSFIGTTAQSIRFADGTEWSATNLSQPLLTLSVPVGLQMGSQPAAIQMQGNGHTLRVGSVRVTAGAGNSPTGLRVQPGKTLAL
ncbi:MAG: filamentous hemagglutinin N-terminal domain-containing protein, partial [Synechococcales bacterium]|nr:filamentous hemagglutinin N-terminal domain-containing protein [Synechococcales bacterium]